MKRHGFKGLGAGHGVQRKHRSPGSIGACATPSRVFKGVRMAGRMGAVRTTTMSLKIQRVDTERGLLLIKGAVPGPDGVLVFVRSAAKRPAPEPFSAVAGQLAAASQGSDS
jgi:large subunit ribosomal protein L3